MSDVLSRFRHSAEYLEALVTLDPERRLSKLTTGQSAGAIGLQRCRRLLEHLGNPEQRLRFVHVTGTSGKGSVVTQVHRILHRAGVRVGSYLSPHVTTPLERIAVGRGLLEPSLWAAMVDRMKPFVEAEYRHGPYGLPSYHELLFALALCAFVELELELVVLEVGIGGTLDSTNVIPAPWVAVVTDVGLDHTEILGRDVATIARDKAGIIKSGCVAITGVRRPEARAEIERRALEVGAPLLALEGALRVMPEGERFRLEWPGGRLEGLEPGMPGAHQVRNAALAAAVAIQLRDRSLDITDQAIRDGLLDAFLSGRFEAAAVKDGGVLVLDIAHNVDKIEGLVETWLARYGRGGAAVVAISADKDAEGMFRALARAFDRVVVTRPLRVTRRMVSPLALLEVAEGVGLEAELRLDPWEAVALGYALGGGRVAVTGSTYLVGEVRQRFQPEEELLQAGQVRRLGVVEFSGLRGA